MGSNQSITSSSKNPSEYATCVDDPALRGPEDPSKWKAYDFIIIGGGTAGCVLASRLSENPAVSVLVLEAGNSHEGNLKSSIPLLVRENFFTDAEWGLDVKPQDKFDGRKLHYPQGKILGGSSSINAMIFHHCSPEDFDSWARNGAEGWSYKDLRPYFLKSEGRNVPPDEDGDHGTSGPIKTRQQVADKVTDIMLETLRKCGISTLKDLNITGTLGAATFVAAVNEKGERSSTSVSYLTPDVLKRPNLRVAVNCRVEKILFDKSGTVNPRAIGVEFRRARDGPLFRAAAKKEVLLCGGAIASPQILLLSGIGPQEELEKQNVAVVEHLPAVGKHLAEHIFSGTLVFPVKQISGLTYDYLNNPVYGLLALAQWLLTGKGIMSGLISRGAAFVRSDDPCVLTVDDSDVLEDTTSGPNSPDIEIIWLPLAVVDNGMTKTSSKTKGLTMTCIALQTKSTGEVSLATKSVWDPPVIDGNYLSDENDIKVVLRALRFCFKLAHSEPLASILELDSEPKYPFFWPGCASPDKVTDEELIQWIRKNSGPAWHPCGSCKMGASENSSVVNYSLQVRGVESLRVIDSSIFPTLVSGHPCAPVVAIAEKASDMIKKQYNI